MRPTIKTFLRTYRKDGTMLSPGDEIRSRTGGLYIYRGAIRPSTPTAFGKILVTQVTNERTGSTKDHNDMFTDFAFNVRVI